MQTPPEKKVFIKTYGCQMNVYDSQRMGDVLAPLGYGETDTPEEADLIVLNTCHIREKAAEKVYSEIGRLRQVRKSENGRNAMIAVAGCVAQAEGEEIVRRAPAVDLVFGPQTYHRLPNLLDEAAKGEGAVVETEFPAEDKFADFDSGQTKPIARGDVSAFVTVQEGCDKFCTFCVVPYTRGAEFSRPVAAIVDEVKKLVDGGVREFTLLGQNVNAYHGEDAGGKTRGLGGLLDILSRLDGVERLRFTTSHPRDMNDELIDVMADNDAVMPYLHLPVQAGSDRILKAMNRQHSAREYMDLIERIRARVAGLALSGDFIVGFPGETDADFEDTMALVREVTYAQAYSFKYSIRPGTRAADSKEQVPENTKSERLQRLQALLKEQQIAFNAGFVGRTMDVLLEREGRFDGQLVGRSPWLQAVHVTGANQRLGELAPVRITDTGPNSLSAEIVASA